MGRRLKAKSVSGSKRRYAAAVIRQARQQGKKFVYLEYSRRQRGIYDLRKLTDESTPLIAARVWDMSKSHSYTRPHPMLYRTLEILKYQFPLIHRAELENQIVRVLKKRGFRPRSANVLAEVARYRAMQK